MARTKVDNKLNVVIGTKAQVEADNTIPENSIVVVTDEELKGITVESWDMPIKTLALSDSNKLFRCSWSSDQTLTIPANATVPFPIGTMVTFLLVGTSTVLFAGESGVTLSSMDNLVELKKQGAMASLIKINTNVWQLVGALDAILGV